MAELSPTLDRRTTKTRSVLFGALRDVGNANVAKALGIAPSTFSEWWKENADRVALLLTTLDHKPVPTKWRCVDPADYDFMRKATIGYLQNVDKQTLEWDAAE
jgi:hypothetical protein